MRISDWSSDVCSSDLRPEHAPGGGHAAFVRNRSQVRHERAGGGACPCPAARLGGAVAGGVRRQGREAGGVRRFERLCRQGPVGRYDRGGRKSCVMGTGLVVRVDLGSLRSIKKTK